MQLPGLYDNNNGKGWWNKGLGRTLEASGPYMIMDVQEHEANWIKVLTLIESHTEEHAEANHWNQTNNELPKWCKDDVMANAPPTGPF